MTTVTLQQKASIVTTIGFLRQNLTLYSSPASHSEFLPQPLNVMIYVCYQFQPYASWVFFNDVLFLITYTYVCVWVPLPQCACGRKQVCVVCFLYHVDSRDQTQAIRLVRKYHLYPLSYLICSGVS